MSLLVNDSTLMAITTDGVYFDQAKSRASAFVLISQLVHEDVPLLGGQRAYERIEYLVKAVILASSGANVKTAAARIDALLENATLTIAGYALMRIQRIERVRYAEVDPENDARWQHRGGRYEVMVCPTG